MKLPLIALGATSLGLVNAVSLREKLYYEALQEIDFDAVKEDIITVMKDSQDDFFPADYGHYGPLFIRHAWHCAGSYRAADGEGGCDGGRQRFEPERSWADNTNLDKPKVLLASIKEKYGLGLSWGDLITLSGTVAIEDMGGPSLGFCAGRVDDLSGEESQILGPTDLQEDVSPCELDGNCTSPLGATVLQLIYVDAAGFFGDENPETSVDPIRDTFDRMGMNDSETVALIGGGHAFGKTHGACTDGPGPTPEENPDDPWPGLCGDRVQDTFTSGFEGPWTSTPINYSNFFFRSLTGFNFTLINETESPGGAHFFVIDQNETEGFIPSAPSPNTTLAAEGGTQDVIMLVTDLALLEDESYRSFVDLFSEDLDELSFAFSHAWYKLMTRDMGPVTRCFGAEVPEAQEFQAPLPDPFDDFPDAEEVAALINVNLDSSIASFTNSTSDVFGDTAAAFIELAYLCASTFRDSDNHGGCNGARVRLSPEIEWEDRAPLAPVVDFLETFRSDAGDISAADFIVFAATEALQLEGGDNVDFFFCSGRSDADDSPISEDLVLFDYEDKIIKQQRHARLLGVSLVEYIALQSRPRSPSYMQALGYQGTYTDETSTLSNILPTTLLSETWTAVEGTSDLFFGQEYVNEDGTKFITRHDFVYLIDDDFLAALFELAASEEFFFATFQKAWTKIMNNDRFDGPVLNLCEDGGIDLINVTEAIVGKADIDDDDDDDKSSALKYTPHFFALIFFYLFNNN